MEEGVAERENVFKLFDRNQDGRIDFMMMMNKMKNPEVAQQEPKADTIQKDSTMPLLSALLGGKIG